MRDRLAVALAAVALAVFLAHASVYDAWIVDDAGITFAYARNVAAGHGPVSQPGMPPVEGYSNPAWMLALVPLYALGVAVVPWGAKALAVAFALAALLLLVRLGREVDPEDGALLGSLAALGAALNPGFVIWCVSGLENPLLAFLAVLLAVLALAAREDGSLAWVAGAGAAALAWTRPDAVVYAAVAPVLWAGWPLPGQGRGEGLRRRLPGYLLGFGVPMALLVAGRGIAFGDVVPNTFHAKGGPSPLDPLRVLLLHPDMVEKGLGLARAVLGHVVGALAATLALVQAARAARAREVGPGLGAILLTAAAAVGSYLLLPADWMGEYRFATPVFPLGILAFLGVQHARARPDLGPRARGWCLALAATLGLFFLPEAWFRCLRFARGPTIGLGFVERAFAERFDRWAALLGVEDGSVLTPDLGGMLLSSNLRVHDLAGLCDPVVARTLGKDRPRLREYVLGELRPTLIHASHKWMEKIRLPADPRFERDYTWIYRYPALKGYDLERDRPGYYVRRDALAGREELLVRLRGERHDWGAFWVDLLRGPVRRFLEALPLPGKAALDGPTEADVLLEGKDVEGHEEEREVPEG